jgi:hypothetical protein
VTMRGLILYNSKFTVKKEKRTYLIYIGLNSNRCSCTTSLAHVSAHQAICLNMFPPGMVWWTPGRPPRVFTMAYPYSSSMSRSALGLLKTNERRHGPAVHPPFPRTGELRQRPFEDVNTILDERSRTK